MAKPSKLPQWATAGGSTVEPAAGEKTAGWAVATKAPARFMNWLFNTIYLWLVWVDDTFDISLTGMLRYYDGSTTRPIPLILYNMTSLGDAFSGGAEAVYQDGAVDVAYEIPANALNRIGATLRMRFEINVSNYGAGGTVLVRVRIGGLAGTAILLQTAAVDPGSTGILVFDLVLVVWVAGATASWRASTILAGGTTTNLNKGYSGSSAASATFDATAAKDLVVTGVKGGGGNCTTHITNMSVWIS